jgi:hypothetical protein
LGGDTKASLPTCERAKIVVNIFDDSITMVRAQQWSSDCLDSIIYLATKSQPATKIHSLSTDPTTLRDMLVREYKFRRSQGAPEVLDCILECGDNQELIINKALADGFIKLNMDQVKMSRVGAIIPRGRELTPQMDIAEKLRQAEMAKVEARHQRETAQLEYEIVQLQRMKTEEQAKQQEAIQRITVATGGRSPTITLTPEKMASATLGTPPLAAASANSPSVDTDTRAAAIARASASRAARLSGGHHVSGLTPQAHTAGYSTPPSTKHLALASTAKAPAPPLAEPDAKRPRVAIPVGSQGSKPTEGAARHSTVDNEKPGAKDKEAGAASKGMGKGRSKENDNRADGAKAARDSTADRSVKAVPPTEGKAAVQKNTEEKGATQLGAEVTEGTAEDNDDKDKAEDQEDDGEAEEAQAEDEGDENQAKVQEGEGEGAEVEGDTDDNPGEAEGAKAEEDIGEAVEDEDMGQVEAEDEARDDTMDNV